MKKVLFEQRDRDELAIVLWVNITDDLIIQVGGVDSNTSIMNLDHLDEFIRALVSYSNKTARRAKAFKKIRSLAEEVGLDLIAEFLAGTVEKTKEELRTLSDDAEDEAPF